MKSLILFDIDGTLLNSNGAAPRAFRQALVQVYGTSGPEEGYSFAGRTDPQIARDLLRMAGLDERRIDAGLSDAWAIYTALLAEEFTRVRASIFPGVQEILARLGGAPEDAVVGLLTGNVVEGARLKLESAGVEWGQFVVGAFGSDHHDRKELPAIAIDRAEEAVGRRFDREEVVIIGDTPFDVACGAHLGVRTLAVATGTVSAGELAECGPDFLFDDLEDTDAVWDAIFHPPLRPTDGHAS